MDARISVSLPAHPKTKKLAKRLGPAGPLGCIYLFLWAASNRSDGDLAGLSAEDIELAIDWSGDDGAFVKAMTEVGFLDGTEGLYTIHDWAEHNPWAAGAEARSEKSRWAALCRRHGRAEAAKLMPEYASRLTGAGDSDTGGMPAACQFLPVAPPDPATGMPLAESGTAPSPSPSPSPIPTPTSKAIAPVPGASHPEREAIEYLNARSGRAFEPVEASLRLVRARLKDGATMAQIRAVIDAKADEWAGTEFEQYLRPATLFNAAKFASYVGALNAESPRARASPWWIQRGFGNAAEAVAAGEQVPA